MPVPVNKNKPIWLARQDVTNKHYKRTIRYYNQLYLAFPDWCSNAWGFTEINNKQKLFKSMGVVMHIDHIVPLCSDIVCGLHVPWNLQLVTPEENMGKGNWWWPDHPFENVELFNSNPEPHQLRLI